MSRKDIQSLILNPGNRPFYIYCILSSNWSRKLTLQRIKTNKQTNKQTKQNKQTNKNKKQKQKQKQKQNKNKNKNKNRAIDKNL